MSRARKPGKPDLLAEVTARFESALHRSALEAAMSAWKLQPIEERMLRRRAILRLAVELDHIKQKDGFGTRLGEAAIESIIEGDWMMVRNWAGHFTFLEEAPELRERYQPIWQVFVALLSDACDQHAALVRGDELRPS